MGRTELFSSGLSLQSSVGELSKCVDFLSRISGFNNKFTSLSQGVSIFCRSLHKL